MEGSCSDETRRAGSNNLLDDDNQFWLNGHNEVGDDDDEVSKDVLAEIQQQQQQQNVVSQTSNENHHVMGATQLEQEQQEQSPPLTMEDIALEYPDIVKHKIFQLAGDDVNGRPVVAFSMCRLPPRTEISHEELFEFMKKVLDQYVENDYTIVYFHYGLNSKNKPSLKFLYHIQQELGRKYKKNLKALLIVHPTNFIKIVFKVLSPLISTKFGRKINHIIRLEELNAIVRLDQLDIPKEVLTHDGTLATTNLNARQLFHKTEDSKFKQFGVPIKHLKETSGHDIPVVVQSAIDFITEQALDVEGIFRRSAQANIMADAVASFNSGIPIEFTMDHVHLAPALLKKFLRDLPEPLLTFELYEKVMESCSLAEEERLEYTKGMLNEELPDDNRLILIHLLQFLQLVIDHSSMNRMNSGSLAIVFGPNLLWSKKETSTLTSMSKINSFTKYIIDNSNLIFDESAA